MRNWVIPRFLLVRCTTEQNLEQPQFMFCCLWPQNPPIIARFPPVKNFSYIPSMATWIKRIRRREKLQDFLAQQEITWQLNLSKSPWWGGVYERLIKEIKKTAYKTLGKTHLTFELLEAVVIDIKKDVKVTMADHKP